MDTLDDKLLLQANYLLEASDPKPVLPSTNNSPFNTMDARPMINDGGQRKPCQDGGTNLEPSIPSPPPPHELKVHLLDDQLL